MKPNLPTNHSLMYETKKTHDISTSKNILEQIIQGISNKIQEVLEITSKVKQYILCTKETMLPVHSNFNINHSNGLFNGRHVKYRAHRGVAMFIHKAIRHTKSSQHSLQVIPATVNMVIEITAVSFYNYTGCGKSS